MMYEGVEQKTRPTGSMEHLPTHLIHHHAPTLPIPQHDLISNVGWHERSPVRPQHGMGVHVQEPEYLIGRHAQSEGAAYGVATKMKEYNIWQSPVRLDVAE
jgi:hypothetical protein